jgi:hypothetical protein
MNSRRWLALVLLLVCALPISAQQTIDDVEKAIAKLPDDQRTYERFRYWVNSLTPAVRRWSAWCVIVAASRLNEGAAAPARPPAPHRPLSPRR